LALRLNSSGWRKFNEANHVILILGQRDYIERQHDFSNLTPVVVPPLFDSILSVHYGKLLYSELTKVDPCHHHLFIASSCPEGRAHGDAD